jgi:hypothetical protein
MAENHDSDLQREANEQAIFLNEDILGVVIGLLPLQTAFRCALLKPTFTGIPSSH